MSEIQYNLQFEKLCNIFQLGEIVNVPKAVSGGLLHRMYAIETKNGKYAIKALNPQIMQKPVARHHFTYSERIACIAANNVPALPAKKFNGTFMQEIDNQCYLVFDWIDGTNRRPNEISINNCEKIASILADIHRTDFSELSIIKNRTDNARIIDWNYYLYKGQENNAVWVDLLIDNIDNLYDLCVQANKSTNLLETDMVISHRDLDPKNVMWNHDNPIIIDWEAAGYINPMCELIETAIYWSENEMGSIDKKRFLAFIREYKKRFGTLQTNWSAVLINGFLSKLDWLEYSLKRSLWIECIDEDEQQMGTVQVTGTINTIRRYVDMISELEKWLNYEV